MIAIIGTGFSGLGMAVRLVQAGRRDFVIFERGEEIGGTWRDNDYPGCACDVPSHVYSYSFDLNPDWSEGYAPQAEIEAYLKGVAVRYDLYPHIHFNHEVTAATWNPEGQAWDITAGSTRHTARYLVAAPGPLGEAALPDIPGRETFRGTTFHSAKWDHAHDLTGERVAVIGTGASAIQFVPQIQPKVASLDLYQRTPPWIIPRMNPSFGRPARTLMRWVPIVMKALRGALYAMQEARVVGFIRPRYMKVAEKVAATHLRRQVTDPQLRAKLTPDYQIGCKRILISDDYYPSLQQPNVDLVTDGIQAITPDGILDASGRERPVDTIIYGTGFSVTEPPIAEVIRGTDGRTLAEHWSDGMQAYRGTTITGFPNLFFMLGPNTGLGHNSMVYMIESQLNYIMDALSVMDRMHAGVFDVLPERQAAFNRWVQKRSDGTVWTAGHCSSWYLDTNGNNTTIWPSWTFHFRHMLREFDSVAYRFEPVAGHRPAAPDTRESGPEEKQVNEQVQAS